MATTAKISRDRFDQSDSGGGCPALKILLADHDRNLRHLASIALRFDGHDVEEVSDGSESLETMASTLTNRDRKPFDLFIVANDLPVITGVTILAGLRARDWETPFILMTDEPKVEARARHLGAVVLGRPTSVDTIRRAVLKAYAVPCVEVMSLV